MHSLPHYPRGDFVPVRFAHIHTNLHNVFSVPLLLTSSMLKLSQRGYVAEAKMHTLYLHFTLAGLATAVKY